MPKKLKVHPNERVDIVDFVRAATDFTAESVAFNVERSVLDRRARILDGFRVEIADQTANPGQITVYNGNAFDRDGKHLNNEDQANAAKTITLSGAGQTFYVELEFTESESDTDARAFWDPTFDQISPIPDGQEFSINATTRISPDWKIVTPVSTTGFDAATDPDSNRVPLIVLVTDGSNEIDATDPGAGFTQVFASTVLESDVAAGITSIRVLDARLFPDTGTFNLDVGDPSVEGPFTITSVDRTNGIIDFAGGPTADPHLAGAIVRMASGVARFVPERVAGSESLTAPSQPDVARRLYQADEVRGSALTASKESYGDRDDLQLRSLKDQVDFLSAQLRELKFGSPRPDVTSFAPPVTFSTQPRYFDAAGGVQGARLPTVSVGDGVTSFGDYNGASHTAVAAAVAFLTAQGGGILHLKAGTYTFTSTVSITVPMTIVGAGRSVTEVVSDVVAAPAFALDTGVVSDDGKIIMEDFKISVGTGAENAVTLETAPLAANQMEFSCGIQLLGGAGVQSRILAYGCLFLPPIAAGGAITGLTDEELVASSFIACTFFEGTGVITAFGCALNNVVMIQCAFTALAVAATLVGTRAWSDVAIYNSQGLLSEGLILADGAVDRMTVDNCSWTVTAVGPGAVPVISYAGVATNIAWKNNLINTTFSGTGVGTQGRVFQFVDDVKNFSAESNRIFVNAGQVVDTFSFEVTTTGILEDIRIVGNYVEVFHRAVRIVGGASVTGRAIAIRDNRFNGDGETFEQHGVLISDGSIAGLIIDNNTFEGIDGGAVIKRGITLETVSTVGITGVVSNNLISVGALTRAAALSAAIFANAGGTAIEQNLVIVGNIIGIVRGTGDLYGIFVDTGGVGVFNRLVISHNQFASIIDTSGAGGTSAIGIEVQDAKSAVISHNTFAEGVTAASGANTAAIGISSGTNVVVSENDVATPVNTGAPTSFESGIILRGTLTNVSVLGNMVQERVASDCIAGIEVLGDGVCTNVNIDYNTILMGTSMTHGILFPSTGSSAVVGMSACGNRITGLQINAIAAGILLDFTNVTVVSGVQANSNLVVENTFDDTHAGIRILGNAGSPMQAVQCNCNVIRGDLAGTGTRSGSTGIGIQLADVDIYQVNSNLVDWNDAAIEGNSIEVEDADHGAIIGNVCRPSDSTFAEILHSNTSTGAIIGGNIVGSAGQGAGTITDTGTDVIRGADNTATEFTNKVS